MDEINTIQIDRICRTCLAEENNMRSVFSTEDTNLGETVQVFEMLMACAAVQIMENDGLPSHICLQCVHYITGAFSFKQLCERSETTLRHLLSKPLITSYAEELKLREPLQSVELKPLPDMDLKVGLLEVNDILLPRN